MEATTQKAIAQSIAHNRRMDDDVLDDAEPRLLRLAIDFPPKTTKYYY
jgi:hypothetical protein